MAVIFTKSLLNNNLLHVHNNNVIEFTGSGASPTVKCTLTIGTRSFVLYPSPAGVFYFNFKDYARVLFSNFNDTLVVNYNVTSQFYDVGSLEMTYNLSILHLDNSTDVYSQLLTFTNSKQNSKEFRDVGGTYFKSSKNIRIWQGYPFDLSLYNGIKITSDNVNFVEAISGGNYRFVLSDGLNFDVSNLLPNKDKLYFYGEGNGVISTINFEKIVTPCTDGHYIKWVNRDGDFSYWLFERGKINRTAKEIGQLNNDFDNFNTSISRTISLGRNSKDTLTVISDVISNEYLDLLVDLIDTPKIYLFTGTPNTVATIYDWLEIELKNTTMPVQEPIRDLHDITFTFDLPEKYTQTL